MSTEIDLLIPILGTNKRARKQYRPSTIYVYPSQNGGKTTITSLEGRSFGISGGSLQLILSQSAHHKQSGWEGEALTRALRIEYAKAITSGEVKDNIDECFAWIRNHLLPRSFDPLPDVKQLSSSQEMFNRVIEHMKSFSFRTEENRSLEVMPGAKNLYLPQRWWWEAREKDDEC